MHSNGWANGGDAALDERSPEDTKAVLSKASRTHGDKIYNLTTDVTVTGRGPSSSLVHQYLSFQIIVFYSCQNPGFLQ